jgi:hypothetical protein
MYEIQELVTRITEAQRRQGIHNWRRWFVIDKVRSKAQAIEIANRHNFRAVVIKPQTSNVLHDNNKEARLDITLDL